MRFLEIKDQSHETREHSVRGKAWAVTYLRSLRLFAWAINRLLLSLCGLCWLTTFGWLFFFFFDGAAANMSGADKSRFSHWAFDSFLLMKSLCNSRAS